MARRTQVVQITAEGRDKGKAFVITEMDADKTEWWAVRCLIVMGNAGVNLPPGVLESGAQGLAFMENSKGAATALFAIGLRMMPGVNPHELKPLMDEMMTCVQYKPPGTFPPQDLQDGMMSQIEEVATRLHLRAKMLELHLGFSLVGAVLNSGENQPPTAPTL